MHRILIIRVAGQSLQAHGSLPAIQAEIPIFGSIYTAVRILLGLELQSAVYSDLVTPEDAQRLEMKVQEVALAQGYMVQFKAGRERFFCIGNDLVICFELQKSGLVSRTYNNLCRPCDVRKLSVEPAAEGAASVLDKNLIGNRA